MLSIDLAVDHGTDGSAYNNAQSNWQKLDTAAKLHKLNTADPKLGSEQQVFVLFRIGGAHLEESIDSIEAEQWAGLTVLEMKAINQVPLSCIELTLVWAKKPAMRVILWLMTRPSCVITSS